MEANVRINAAPSGIPRIVGAACGRRIGAARSTGYSTSPTRFRGTHSGGVSVIPSSLRPDRRMDRPATRNLEPITLHTREEKLMRA